MARAKLTSASVVISRPRITEKASFLAERNFPVYTFEVPAEANKIAIKRAIKEKYNVDVLKVAVINLPSKKVVVRGKRGVKPGLKKAMVTLPKGSQIDFI